MPSAIEWTDETWNPVTGCTRVSPGCRPLLHVRALPAAEGRWESPDTGRLPRTCSSCPNGCRRRLSWKKPRLVFVNSMADLFHQRVPYEFIFEAFSVMQEAAAKRGHVFQVLTKRPGRAVGWWEAYGERFPGGLAAEYLDRDVGRESEVRATADGAGATTGSGAFRVGGAAARTDWSSANGWRATSCNG